jgi:hypothetical protein
MASPTFSVLSNGSRVRKYPAGGSPADVGPKAAADLADWAKLPGQDSREAAYNHLEAVKTYIESINEDILRQIKPSGKLKIKDNAKHRAFLESWNSFYTDWTAHYNQVYTDGIGYFDVENVEQKTTDFHNKAKGYQETLNTILAAVDSGGPGPDTVTPVPPDEKAPPGAKLPGVDLGEAAGGIGKVVLAGAGALLLVTLLRR